MSLVRIKELEDQLARRGARIEELEREREKLREDYEAQGLALKASKAMQLAETQRADALEQDHTAALRLVAEVRFACGDDGKRMLPELVQYVGELAMDAERYRWLRGQLWSDSALAVVSDPKCNVRLGTYCPIGSLLDSAIDAAMEQAKSREEA